VVVGLCLALAACAGTSSGVAHPVPTATATPIPQVRFAADWSQGLGGWQATPGWSVTNGALESSTGDGLALSIPYRPPTSTYTIEIDLAVVDVARDGGYFIFDVPSAAGADGYQAGVNGLRAPGPHPYADHPTIRATITPLGDQDSSTRVRPEADIEPGDGVNTYRIAVDGPAVAVYVNGRFEVAGSSTGTPRLATGPLILRVQAAQVRISGLRVIA
jgi:hypothetical protein